MTATNNFTDNELLLLLKAGNVGAFTILYDRYYDVLYRHAYRRLPEGEEVRDILQELFLYLWNNRESISFTTGFAAYMYGAVRNRILDVYRHQRIISDYIVLFQQYLNDAQPIPDAILREKELIALIEKEVAALPAKMRLVFELSRNKNLSHQEIADRTKI